MSNPRKIRWLIAHHPQHLFVRTAKAFQYELQKLCPNQFELEILTMQEYADKYDKFHEFKSIPPGVPGLETETENTTQTWKENNTKWQVLFDALRDGEFELSQTQVSIIGGVLDKTYHAIDLPFIFNDHDHVTRVLDGEIGDRISEGLAKRTDIKGLAFTYSGGYRLIGSKQAITNLSELAQTKLLTHTRHSKVLFQGIGNTTVVPKMGATIQELGDAADANNTAVETTYLRFNGKHVYKTEHSMFTTSILTGTKFWNTLTTEQQDAFKLVAKKVAKIERRWSLEDCEKYEKEAEEKGISIVDISAEDRAKLKAASVDAYRDFESICPDPALVQMIIDKGNEQ
jgi:TRAP-type C4-dicarboxylate transport system substrate-binding protein